MQDAKSSPAEEAKKKVELTTRTKRRIFEIERELDNVRTKGLLFNFMLKRPEIVANKLGVNVPKVYGKLAPIPIDTYGYFAGPLVKLPQWKYPYPIRNALLSPRVLITTSVKLDEINYGRPLEYKNEEGKLVETSFSHRPIKLLAILTVENEIIWDWSDLEAVEESSFEPRVLALQFSLRMFLQRYVHYIVFGEISHSQHSSLHVKNSS